jgi:hypothetical protein
MGMIPLDKVQEGAVLEKDIADNGQILIKAGMKLTERHLKLCLAWGIIELPIKGVDANQIEQDFLASIPPEFMKAAEEKRDQKFKLVDPHHPATPLLSQIYLFKILKGYTK